MNRRQNWRLVASASLSLVVFSAHYAALLHRSSVTAGYAGSAGRYLMDLRLAVRDIAAWGGLDVGSLRVTAAYGRGFHDFCWLLVTEDRPRTDKWYTVTIYVDSVTGFLGELERVTPPEGRRLTERERGALQSISQHLEVIERAFQPRETGLLPWIQVDEKALTEACEAADRLAGAVAEARRLFIV